jgi:hypothetical protein
MSGYLFFRWMLVCITKLLGSSNSRRVKDGPIIT